MSVKKRNPAADVVRVFAFFCVISVHFFFNNGFYKHPIVGEKMLVMTVIRSFFMICVPLFLILSGFLMRKKTLSKDYYKKVSKVIITYILASIACLLYAVFALNEDITFKDAFFKILGFSGAPYGGYIEMYLGLFLLIPFLNMAYNNTPSRKWKLGLIITFVVLTSLPSVMNVYNFKTAEWWLMPSSSASYNQLIPAWWDGMYPITYYFIGCYLSEYGLKINKKLNFALIILCTLGSGAYSFWRSYNKTFIWGDWGQYPSLFTVVLATLVFAFLININYEKVPDKLSLLIQKISGLSLGGYLLSWIFDTEFYPVLAEKVPLVTDRLVYYFVMVPLVFVLSAVASYLLSRVQWLVEKLIALAVGLFSKKQTKQISNAK